jgi:hypothetical protein
VPPAEDQLAAAAQLDRRVGGRPGLGRELEARPARRGVARGDLGRDLDEELRRRGIAVQPSDENAARLDRIRSRRERERLVDHARGHEDRRVERVRLALRRRAREKAVESALLDRDRQRRRRDADRRRLRCSFPGRDGAHPPAAVLVLAERAEAALRRDRRAGQVAKEADGQLDAGGLRLALDAHAPHPGRQGAPCWSCQIGVTRPAAAAVTSAARPRRAASKRAHSRAGWKSGATSTAARRRPSCVKHSIA